MATATLAGAPQRELGVIAPDETLRGAAGRAFLAAHLHRCLPVTTGQGAANGHELAVSSAVGDSCG